MSLVGSTSFAMPWTWHSAAESWSRQVRSRYGSGCRVKDRRLYHRVVDGTGSGVRITCWTIRRLGSALDNRAGVGFSFGNSAFVILKRARLGELFLRLSDSTRVASRLFKIGSRPDLSWPVAIEARVPGQLAYVKLCQGGNGLYSGLQLRGWDPLQAHPKHSQIRALHRSSSLSLRSLPYFATL